MFFCRRRFWCLYVRVCPLSSSRRLFGHWRPPGLGASFTPLMISLPRLRQTLVLRVSVKSQGLITRGVALVPRVRSVK